MSESPNCSKHTPTLHLSTNRIDGTPVLANGGKGGEGVECVVYVSEGSVSSEEWE